MRTARLLAVAAIAAATVSCAANTDTAPDAAEPAASSSPTAGTVIPSPGPTGNPAPATAPPAGSARTTAGNPSPRPNGEGVTPGPTDGDRRGDLVRGARTLTGTVYRDADWVLLDVAGVRWALLGEPARTLKAGQTATATGTLTQPPAGCPVNMALTVTRVVPA